MDDPVSTDDVRARYAQLTKWKKPRIPYIIGRKLELHSHTPSPPPGKPYPNNRPKLSESVILNSPHLKLCLSHPPQDGPAHDTKKTFTLEISHELAVEEGRGAQVFVGNNRLVAKIFDPLYYPENESRYLIEDATQNADMDYSREVAAYKELEASCGGKQIPSFHGSWTCHVPTQSPLGLKMRPVRLILIEYLRGSSLLDLKPTLYSEQNRLIIVAQAMEAWVTIHHEGVSQGDFSPRNVLLCEPLDGDSRVAIVDFSLSVVGRLASGKCHKDRFKLPLSPLARFIGDSNDFIAAGWLPESFDWMWER